MEHTLNPFLVLTAFLLIAISSKQIGGYFARIHLPLISGFLFTGMLAGPFGLGLISREAVDTLHFIDQLSLAVIAFAAGSELYLSELRSRFKSIKWVSVGLVTFTFTLGSFTVFCLSDFVPFLKDMTPSGRLAVSLLAGAILVARSPSSAIAVINELRARGPFTKTVLGVTVVIDVAVIALYATNSSVADALMTGMRISPKFVFLVAAELLISLPLGWLLGKVLQFILSRYLHAWIKAAWVLLAGYLVFALAGWVRDLSYAHLPFELFLEPLLICLIGAFVVVNYSPHRDEFLKIVGEIGPPIYTIFFTLTGASLALDSLSRVWYISLVLFMVRMAGLFLGSFTGGVLAREPMRDNRIAWMSYVTQAGVGLGLAKEVASEFPGWGPEFATLMISVIVLNQLVGPVLFKWAITLVGEAHQRAEAPGFDGERNAVIFGLERQSVALARQLKNHGWRVKIATRNTGSVQGEGMRPDIVRIPDFSVNSFHKLGAEKANAVVALLSDEENYRICETAFEHFGTDKLVVRLRDHGWFERFREMGALILEPNTAMVSLLDHFVRSPSETSLLLGLDPNRDVVEIEIRNPDLDGMFLRDLRMPQDVLVVSVRRGDQSLLSHGYTVLKVGDWVTIVGTEESIEQMMLQFDG